MHKPASRFVIFGTGSSASGSRYLPRGCTSLTPCSAGSGRIPIVMVLLLYAVPGLFLTGTIQRSGSRRPSHPVNEPKDPTPILNFQFFCKGGSHAFFHP